MKRSEIAGFLFITALMISPSQAMPGYLGMTITEYDMLGCKTNSDNPRCRKVVNIGCKSICVGHENDTNPLGAACQELCPHQKTENKSQLPLLTDLSFPIPEED